MGEAGLQATQTNRKMKYILFLIMMVAMAALAQDTLVNTIVRTTNGVNIVVSSSTNSSVALKTFQLSFTTNGPSPFIASAPYTFFRTRASNDKRSFVLSRSSDLTNWTDWIFSYLPPPPVP